MKMQSPNYNACTKPANNFHQSRDIILTRQEVSLVRQSFPIQFMLKQCLVRKANYGKIKSLKQNFMPEHEQDHEY